VLATCDIQPPDEAFENTQSHHLLLADSEEEEYNLKHSSFYLHKGVMYTVHGILTFIKRLTGLCRRVAPPLLRCLDKTGHHLAPGFGR
jgi:hypothetical protein